MKRYTAKTYIGLLLQVTANYLKARVEQFKGRIIKSLMTKCVIAIQLHKAVVKQDVAISSVGLSVSQYQTGRISFCVTIHYVTGGDMGMFHYDDLEMAHQDFNYLQELILKENAVAVQLAKDSKNA